MYGYVYWYTSKAHSKQTMMNGHYPALGHVPPLHLAARLPAHTGKPECICVRLGNSGIQPPWDSSLTTPKYCYRLTETKIHPDDLQLVEQNFEKYTMKMIVPLD